MSDSVVNVIIAGLGGQGVLTASDILAEAAFCAGLDVKKSELHGMSQRGGSVSSDVRFGPRVHSPMVPQGQADFLLVLSEDQVAVNRHQLKAGGVLVSEAMLGGVKLPNSKSVNVALLGMLSRHLQLPPEHWHAAIKRRLPAKIHEVNVQAFDIGRGLAK